MTAFNARRHDALPYDILAPERARRTARPMPQEQVLDAEFVTIAEPARQARPVIDPAPVNDNHGQAAANNRFYAMAGAAAQQFERKLAGLSVDRFSALVAAAAVVVFAAAGGLSILTPLPQASATPVAPLAITHVSLTPQDANGMKLILVNGIIENNTADDMALRPIRADLHSGGTLLRSIVIEPPVARIKAGESRGFAARLAHPGGKVPEVTLSFHGKDVPGA